MTISYIAGTTAGSVFAYVLDRIIHYEVGWSGGNEYHNTIVRGGFELINKSLLIVHDPVNRTSSTAAAVSPALTTTAAAATATTLAAAAATTTIGRLAPVLVLSSMHVNGTAATTGR